MVSIVMNTIVALNYSCYTSGNFLFYQMQCRLFVIIRWHSKYVNMPKFVIIRSDIKQSVSAPKLVTIRFYDKLCLKITIRMHGLRIVTFQSCKPI